MKKKPGTSTPPLPHPRTHDLLLGHRQQERLVLDSFHNNKMPHAWMITGQKGIGKATLAYRIAKFLTAHPPASTSLIDTETALQHPIARRIAQGSCGDLLVLEEQDGKDISVDQVREIAHFLHLSPAESAYRIVIIDSADALNANAANALLKLLEEPPANSFLFLISHMPGSILPTIRSRCRMLALQPPSPAEALHIVQAHCPGVLQDQQLQLLGLAEGSPGTAIAFHHHNILAYYQELLQLLSTLPALDHHASYKLAELHASKTNPLSWEHFNWLLGRLLSYAVKLAAGLKPEGMMPEETALLTRLGAHSTLDKWLELWEKVTTSLEEATRINLDYKQITLVVLDMIRNTIIGKAPA